MDLQEQRITCLRMAVDMGAKADLVFGLASELMGFVTSGAVPSAVASAPVAVSMDRTAPIETETALPLSGVAPGAGQAHEPTRTAVEAVSEPTPEPAPSPGETAAAPPAQAEVAEPAPPASPAGAVEVAKPLDVPAAAAEAREPVRAAIVAAPAGEVESAAQPETSPEKATNPADEASALAEVASSAPTAPAGVAEPIVAEQSAVSAAIGEATPTAGDEPTQGASMEVPPPKTNGASKADAASAAPTAS